MQPSRHSVSVRLIARCLSAILAFLFVAAVPGVSQTITPPNFPGNTLPYPYLYLNASSHWGYMAPQNTNGTTSGFLPSVPVTRVVGNVHWGNIMSGPPSGTYPDNQGVYSQGLASIGMNLDPGSYSGCVSSVIDNWWPAATCNKAAGVYNAAPNNILYTFYTVPYWASVINGTHGSPLTGWTTSSSTCTTSGGACTVNLSTTGNPGINHGSKVILNVTDSGGNNHAYTLSVNATPTMINSTTYQISVSPGSLAAVPTSSNSYTTFTDAQPPSDATNTTETCNMPDGNAATGHCFFKEYVDWMMMSTCKDTSGHFGAKVTFAPGDPNALSTCVIHYWEGWNEFNSDGYWTGNHTELAQMMNDAAYIIHQYCNNCYVGAGSVTAGGQAGHSDLTLSSTDSSGMYVQALGQLLRDWKNLGASTKPDFVTVHPYPGYDNIYMPAMPETTDPAQWDPSVSPYSTGLAANACTSKGSPTGCINICSSKPYNPLNTTGNITDGSCTSIVANPMASASGDKWAGAAFPGCGQHDSGATPNFTNFGYEKYILNYTDPVPSLHCIDSYINVFRAVREALTDVGVQEGISGWSSFISPTAPIWSTESGFGNYSETDFRSANTASGAYDPYDQSLMTFYEQAYVARMGILGAESGAGLNLWYQWDENTTGTPLCSDSDTLCKNLPADLKNPYQSVLGGTGSVWGQMGNDFTAGTTPFNGTMRPVRAAFTYNRVYSWLLGATFSGVAPATVARSHVYTYGDVAYDGANVVTVKVSGTTSSSAPASWNDAVYGTTTDGSVTWENMGDKNCRDTSTFSAADTLSANVWSCAISRTGGYTGTIVWYAPFDGAIIFNTPTGQTCLRDIDGNKVTETAGSGHHIYNRPALFDNSSSCSGTDGLPEADYTP